MATNLSTALTYIRNNRSNSESSFLATRSQPKSSPKKKAPLTSWTRFKESKPKIFTPNWVGLETQNLKPGFRTLVKEELELETKATMEELEYEGKRFG